MVNGKWSMTPFRNEVGARSVLPQPHLSLLLFDIDPQGLRLPAIHRQHQIHFAAMVEARRELDIHLIETIKAGRDECVFHWNFDAINFAAHLRLIAAMAKPCAIEFDEKLFGRGIKINRLGHEFICGRIKRDDLFAWQLHAVAHADCQADNRSGAVRIRRKQAGRDGRDFNEAGRSLAEGIAHGDRRNSFSGAFWQNVIHLIRSDVKQQRLAINAFAIPHSDGRAR